MRKERWCLQNLSLMAKRFQHSSLDSDEKFKADRISQLPDEILASILSFLTTKEASTTSVLSSRWRTLWRLTSSLNFDCSKKASEREWDSWALRRERIRFAIWVKRVLEVYRGSKLDEFIVSFDLTCNSRCSLNKWMAFAMSKRLKRLEISLAPFSPTELRFDDERYGFPIYCYNFIREPQGGSYGGKREKLQVVNLPHLVDLHLGGPEICITEDFGACSSNFSRLMTLKIVITETCMDKEARLEFPKFPALTNLKHLIFKTEYDLCSIRGVPLLIKSSPLLHKFTLELTDCSRCKLKRRVRKNTNCPHPNLRIVEIVGFVGGAVEFEFVMFFLENASALEKIILHPLDPISPSEAENKKQLSRARVRAERFKTRFSSRVEVVYYVIR